MKQHVDWIEIKSPDWKIISITDENGKKTADVSVNRVNKKGETFPNFDGITLSADVEGELWQSPTGKWYLFAPKLGGGPRRASGGSLETVKQVAKNVEKSQERKEDGIKVSATFRDATLLAVAEYQANRSLSSTGPSLETLWSKWRQFCVDNWGIEDAPF